MIDVSIIGAGRLGTSLGYALLKKGHRIKALSCKRISSARESRQIIGEGEASTDNALTAREGDLVILCLPDEEIVKVAEELADSNVKWSKKYIFHSSGLLPSKILDPLRVQGALVASFHPIQSFSQKKTDPKYFENIYYGLEGGREALVLSQKIVHELGGHPIIIKEKDKSLYHAACSIASNFFVVLLDMATSLLKQTGLSEKEAFQALQPLVQGTLHNVKNLNIKDSLTGPVIRGDQESVRKHLKALRNIPLYYETYKKLAAQAVEIAKKEKKLTPQKIKALNNLLEGK